jgi:hypothetical protein
MKANTKIMVPYLLVANKQETLFYAKDDSEAIRICIKQSSIYRLYRLYYTNKYYKKILIRNTEPPTLWQKLMKFFGFK